MWWRIRKNLGSKIEKVLNKLYEVVTEIKYKSTGEFNEIEHKRKKKKKNGNKSVKYNDRIPIDKNVRFKRVLKENVWQNWEKYKKRLKNFQTKRVL